MLKEPDYDLEQLRLTTTLIPQWGPDCCYELRAIDWWDQKSDPDRRFPKVVSGYYDNPSDMARDAARLSGHAEGVYLIPNPIRRELICRSKNRLLWKPRHTSLDDDVIRRLWLLVDCDAIRPTGVSSTDSECVAALEKADAIREYLLNLNTREVILSLSGNGAHVLVRIDDPNDKEHLGKCRETLERISAKFSDDRVKIDAGLFNAARLIRFYGTKAMKGSHAPEEGRPHRISRILKTSE